MYCANCGVKLADTEQSCPLCGLAAYHPALPPRDAEPLYPQREPQVIRKQAALIVLTTIFLIPLLITLLVDLRISQTVTWSGFVIGALITGYVLLILPLWFRKRNPVIFTPCSFGTVLLYLLYIDMATGGGWFLPFAFPVVGGMTLIVTAVVTLLYYVRQGVLFILGGAFIATGAFMPLVEYLLNSTFLLPLTSWSIYPLVTLVLLGGMLLFLAISPAAREAVERRLFL